MTQEYVEYLASDAWKQKREERLRIGKYQCAACGSNKKLHVHHLTYARIFKEDMADLLPLCQRHHEAVEEEIKKGILPRVGDVLFLATETIRRVLKYEPTVRKKPAGRPRESTRIREKLLSEQWFQDALRLKRKEFKRLVWSRVSEFDNRNRVAANCFYIYDHGRKSRLNKINKKQKKHKGPILIFGYNTVSR